MDKFLCVVPVARGASIKIFGLFAVLILSSCCQLPPAWRAPTTLVVGRLQIQTDEDPKLAWEVAQEAEAFLSRLEPWLGKTDQEPIELRFFRSYDDFQERMKAHGEGITYYGCCKPLVGLPRWPLELEDLDPDFMEQVLDSVGSDWRFRLRHELVHVIFRRAEGLERDWLWEGVADYFAHEGQLGGGMKAGRFLSLKQRERELHSLDELRSFSINASRRQAELLYAEAWSVVYTLMNECGLKLRDEFIAWLKAGAPGELEAVLARAGCTVAQVDERRWAFIARFECFLEATEVPPGGSAWQAGLCKGDRLIQLHHLPVNTISSRQSLSLALNYVFDPPEDFVAGEGIPCLVMRPQGFAKVALTRGGLSSVRWQLTARPVSNEEGQSLGHLLRGFQPARRF